MRRIDCIQEPDKPRKALEEGRADSVSTRIRSLPRNNPLTG